MEEWRDIVGYEGLYQVSNLGRVKSLKNHKGTYREKILKPMRGTLKSAGKHPVTGEKMIWEYLLE